MKKTHSNHLGLCAFSLAIGILFSACQKKSDEGGTANGGGDAPEQALASDLSDNLDLTVVVAVFGESESLEDFEKNLNDPERQISNLDLNEDGEVDYLRVVESAEDDIHLVSVQAVLGEDMYQDVAVFDVERSPEGETQVQVVGDPHVYGEDYVIRPSYSRPPILTALLWGAAYKAWRSPYRWDDYPSYYRPWSPYPSYHYRDRVSRYRHPNYSHGYWSGKRSKKAISLYNESRRYDYAKKHSGNSFNKRNKGVTNRYELTQKRGKSKVPTVNKKGPEPAKKPGGKPVLKPAPGKPNIKPGKPTSKPAAGKPSAKPTLNKPAAKPKLNKPNVKPATKPAAKPSVKPTNKLPKKPSGKPQKKGK